MAGVLGRSDVGPLRGLREAVLAEWVNPKYADHLVARRVTRKAAAAKWLGAMATCLRGDRGRQRSERLGSGSSSAQHAQRGGSASATGSSPLGETRDTVRRAEARRGFCRNKGTRRDTSRPKRAIANSTAHLPRSRQRELFWTGQAPTPNDDGDRPYAGHAVRGRSRRQSIGPR